MDPRNIESPKAAEIPENIRQKLTPEEVTTLERARGKALVADTAAMRMELLNKEITSFASKLSESDLNALVAVDGTKAAPSSTVPVAAAATAAVAAGTGMTQNLRKKVHSVENFFKNPLITVASWFWYTPESIVADYKNARELKNSDDFFDRINGTIQLFFAGMVGKFLGVDLTNVSWENEKNTNASETLPESQESNNSHSESYAAARLMFEKMFLKSSDEKLPVTNILDHREFKKMDIIDLYSVYREKTFDKILQKWGLPTDDSHKKALERILESTFDTKKSNKARYILDAYNSANGLPKGSSFPIGVSFETYLLGASSVLRGVKNVAMAIYDSKLLGKNINAVVEGDQLADTPEAKNAVKIFGGDKKLVMFLFATAGSRKYFSGNASQTIADLSKNSDELDRLYPDAAEKHKALEKIQKMLESHEKFLLALQNNPDIHLWMQSEITEITKKPFSFFSIASFYTLLDGKDLSAWENLSTAEHCKVYAMVISLFQMQGADAQDKGRLHAKYFGLLQNSSAKIPREVMNFLSEITGNVVAKGIKGASGMVSYFWGAFRENPIMGSMLALAGAPIFTEKTSIIGKVIN